MRRVLHVITNFERLAGAEQALINLLWTGLSEESMVLALRSDALASTVSLPAGCSAAALGIGPRDIVAAVRGVRKAIEQYKPDVVLSWMYHANCVTAWAMRSARRRVPLVWTVHHALDDLLSESRSTKLAIAASVMVSQTADAIVYTSSRARDQHRRLFRNSKRSIVIPNVVMTERSGTERVRTPGKTVGFAARYHPTKDFRTFVRTVRLVHASDPAVRFVACGQGASMDNVDLADLARKEGLLPGEIEWRGPHDNMAEFYSEIDLLLLTSRAEGFGMVLAEAMGHGVPCVTTDVGAAREIVGSIGRITPVGDTDALARAILEEFRQTEAERRARSRAAIKYFGINFHPTVIRKRFENLLFNLE